MKNIKGKIIPIIALSVFIAIMTTGSILKHPFYDKDDVIYYVDQLNNDIKDKKWELAHENLKHIKRAWKHVVYRIQFSSERDEINAFKKSTERIGGFITAQDKSGALAELAEMRFIWKELGK